jgi:uncharacterized protein (DUF849 family)
VAITARCHAKDNQRYHHRRRAVESTQAAYEAGATLVHPHVRNDDDADLPADRFALVLDGIRKHCPGMITQVSTGGRSGAGRARRRLRPDMASLASGSVLPDPSTTTPDLVDWLAAEMKTYGIKPEIEAFDLSMIFKRSRRTRARSGLAAHPVRHGHQERHAGRSRGFGFYVRTLARLAPDATWTGAGIGKEQLTLAVVARARRPLPHRPRTTFASTATPWRRRTRRW